eukprot:7391765-Prymnesium_polylepis.1
MGPADVCAQAVLVRAGECKEGALGETERDREVNTLRGADGTWGTRANSGSCSPQATCGRYASACTACLEVVHSIHNLREARLAKDRRLLRDLGPHELEPMRRDAVQGSRFSRLTFTRSRVWWKG